MWEMVWLFGIENKKWVGVWFSVWYFFGQGNNGKYLRWCYFWGIYIIRCQGVNVKPIRWPGCGVVLAVVGWLVKIRANEKE